MPRRKSISDEEILDRALPLMARDGPAEFTLASLARELGLAPATLLQRFGSKQALIERTFARDNHRFVAWLENLPAGTGLNVVIGIYGDATGLFGDASSLADQLLWLREDIRNPVLNRLARERFDLFRIEIVRRLPEMPVPRQRVADLLDAQFHGAVIQWALDPRGSLREFVVQNLADLFRLGGPEEVSDSISPGGSVRGWLTPTQPSPIKGEG